MTFTPFESSIGGILIGIAVASHYYFVGRIAGVSGNFSSIFSYFIFKIQKKHFLISLSFISGIIISGYFSMIFLRSPFNNDIDIKLPQVFKNFSPILVYLVLGI